MERSDSFVGGAIRPLRDKPLFALFRGCKHAFLVPRLVGVLTVLAITTFMIASQPQSASAHYVYEEGYTWEDGEHKCVETYSEISHGDGRGYTAGRVHAVKETLFDNIACQRDWERPTGYLRVQPDLWYWTGSQWAYCIGLDPHHNTQPASKLQQGVYHQMQCGEGWYGAHTLGQTYHDGRWRGGRMWSGAHWLPA